MFSKENNLCNVRKVLFVGSHFASTIVKVFLFFFWNVNVRFFLLENFHRSSRDIHSG